MTILNITGTIICHFLVSSIHSKRTASKTYLVIWNWSIFMLWNWPLIFILFAFPNNCKCRHTWWFVPGWPRCWPRRTCRAACSWSSACGCWGSAAGWRSRSGTGSVLCNIQSEISLKNKNGNICFLQGIDMSLHSTNFFTPFIQYKKIFSQLNHPTFYPINLP